jgi:hypothetical protein
MAPKSTCSDCRWWHFQAAEADDRDAGKSIGYCRRFPPSRRENGVGAWPITLGYDWCGEYQERNGACGQVARGGSPPP